MKLFIVLATFTTFSLAKPSGFLLTPAIPAVRSAILQTAPAQTQFHAQDALGQYSYGYSDGLSAKQEVKSLDGITRGSYSYIDAEGKLQSAEYIADASNGFRIAATNLPKGPEPLPIPELKSPEPVGETLEVIAAKSAHLAAIEKAKNQASQPEILLKSVNIENLPKPVEDTPEVALAKAKHLKAKKEIEAGIISPQQISLSVAPAAQTLEVAPLALGTPVLKDFPIESVRFLPTAQLKSAELAPLKALEFTQAKELKFLPAIRSDVTSIKTAELAPSKEIQLQPAFKTATILPGNFAYGYSTYGITHLRQPIYKSYLF